MGDDTKNPFDYQKPTDVSVEVIKEVRHAYKALHALILNKIPHSRERAVAITELETSNMWANKAIVFNQVDEQPVQTDGNSTAGQYGVRQW